MKRAKKVITLFVCLFLPIRFFFWLLNLMGHKVHPKAHIGFSLIWMNGSLSLSEFSRIGNFNIVRVNSVTINPQGYIGNFNRFNGPFDIFLADTAAIGNGNSCYRAPLGVTYSNSVLKLGVLSKITANHSVDCTRSIVIGNFTTIAGHNSQLWTHAYYHDTQGPGRFRLDGSIVIGNNVYIGSNSVINCGVTITDAVVVGANSSISKSLLMSGTYVNQPLRFIETIGDQRQRFKKVDENNICEEVYERIN